MFTSEYCNDLSWMSRPPAHLGHLAIASIPKETATGDLWVTGMASGSQAGHIRIAARILGIDAKLGPS